MRELVAEFDPHTVALCEAPDMWRAADRVERLAAAVKVLLAPRVEQAGMWKRTGHKSAAEQLAADAGTSVPAAQSLLDTSKRIASQPKTERALRAGELSGRKAELVAHAVDVVPDAADRLLELATSNAPVGKLRQACVEAKASVGRDESHARIRKERSAREYTDDEGVWHFHARGTVDDGARFRAAWEPIVDELFRAAHQQGRREPREAYAFDALIELARRAAQPTESKSAKQARRQPSPKFLGLVRVDHAALARGAVDDGEVCEIAGLGPIPVSTARDLLGDAILKVVLTKGQQVANVTSLRRSPTMAQQVALWWQAPACQVIDCTRTRRLENDHRDEWCKTHVTDVETLDPLCGHHHWLKTVLGWALVEGTGRREMVAPDDPRHPKNKPK